jgi:hypothetical protein
MMYMATVVTLAGASLWQVSVPTVLCEALQEGADNHDAGACHDSCTPSIFLIEPWSYRDGKNGSKLVARRDETKHCWPDIGLLGLGANVPIAKVYLG